MKEPPPVALTLNTVRKGLSTLKVVGDGILLITVVGMFPRTDVDGETPEIWTRVPFDRP